MRAVIDTNVLVSAVLGGTLAEVFDHWRAGQFTWVVSDDIMREYLDVLRRPKFALPADVVDTIIGYLFHQAEFAIPAELLRVIAADPKDDKFLEAAVAGRADVIVSGDQHLLALKAYREIPIIAAREFLDRLQRESSMP